MITLSTDFGQKDGYVGIMKGVILTIAPHVQLMDLSHDIRPQDVFGGALLLGRSASYFPAGTIHVAVVDPGVGTQRKGMAAQIGEQYFIGPDNGLITFLVQEAQKQSREMRFFCLQNPTYRLATVSHTFHGRDFFAPAAGHLANGVSLEEFGDEIAKPVLLDIPAKIVGEDRITGEILHCDHFGNLVSNIRQEDLPTDKTVRVSIKGRSDIPLTSTFAEAEVGDLIAFFDSFGFLAVAEVDGNAAHTLGAAEGEKITVYLT